MFHFDFFIHIKCFFKKNVWVGVDIKIGLNETYPPILFLSLNIHKKITFSFSIQITQTNTSGLIPLTSHWMGMKFKLNLIQKVSIFTPSTHFPFRILKLTDDNWKSTKFSHLIFNFHASIAALFRKLDFSFSTLLSGWINQFFSAFSWKIKLQEKMPFFSHPLLLLLEKQQVKLVFFCNGKIYYRDFFFYRISREIFKFTQHHNVIKFIPLNSKQP